MEKRNEVKDALSHVRAAAQELHGAISDVAANRGGDIKAQLEAIPEMAKAVMESLKSSMSAQSEAAKKSLAEAVTFLEATQKHAAESAKSSGQAVQTALRQALADARASVDKISEAVAAKRAAESKQAGRK